MLINVSAEFVEDWLVLRLGGDWGTLSFEELLFSFCFLKEEEETLNASSPSSSYESSSKLSYGLLTSSISLLSSRIFYCR